MTVRTDIPAAMQSTAHTDRLAVALSFACIIHCLALPVLALVLPILGVLAEAEIIHWVFGALAIAASISIPVRSARARRASFIVPAAFGAALIAVGLFAEHVNVDETWPTVIGGVFLSLAHLWRLFQR